MANKPGLAGVKMSPWRLSGRRLVTTLILSTVLVSLFVVFLLHSREVRPHPNLFRIEDRVVFTNLTKLNIKSSNLLFKSPIETRALIYNGKAAAEITETGRAKIPRIIHQTWSTYQIPKSVAKWVKSFLEKNPEFEYWFWTDADALKLVKKRYPQYLTYYNGYEKSIQRADVMRYLLLLEFGGFYTDLDISAVKSLEPLRSQTCIISQEPWVHAKVYWHLKHLLPCNAFMASAPGHPFMKLLVETIPRNYKGNDPGDVMNKTGPMMLDRILNDYKRTKGQSFKDFERVFLAEPNLFHPMYDPNLRGRYIQGCSNPEKYHLDAGELEECRESKLRRYIAQIPAEAYTDHHWMHYWVGGTFINRINPSDSIHIKDLVPDFKNVSQILDSLK